MTRGEGMPELKMDVAIVQGHGRSAAGGAQHGVHRKRRWNDGGQ